MKETTFEELAQNLNAFMEAAQREKIVVTRNGAPWVVMVGIQNKDEEQLHLESSPEFWRMIEERRRLPTIPLKEVEAALRADE